MTALTLSPATRLLIIAPHPDDETLGSGALLLRAVRSGAAMRVIFATSGENNPWPQRAAFAKWSVGQREQVQWAHRRRNEALHALQLLGVAEDCAFFLNYPDAGLTSLLVNDATPLLDDLKLHIDEFKPTHVVSPALSDRHPDHNALGLLCELAIERCADIKQIVHLRYEIHGALSFYASDKALRLHLTDDEKSIKRAAIMAHGSQMLLSRRRFLSYAGDEELLVEGSQPSDTNPDLQLTVESPGTVLLRSARSPLPGAKVLLMSKSGQALQITLPPSSPRSHSSTLVPAQGSTSCVRVEMSRHSAVIGLPVDLALSSAWVKLVTRWRFFDVNGWERLAHPPLPAPRRERVCAVIPCYNVATLCANVVAEAARYADHVLVVDDGSTDGTREVLEEVAAQYDNVELLVHVRNCGKGTALLTAFRYALNNVSFDTLVTLDGDNQHRPCDIPRLATELTNIDAPLCIGERDAFNSMPLRSRIGNEITAALFRLRYSNAPHDTQSGFRALTHAFVGEIVESIAGKRYETELQILLAAMQHGKGVATVPIPTVYLDGNKSSHFNPLLDSIRIFSTLFSWWARQLMFHRESTSVYRDSHHA